MQEITFTHHQIAGKFFIIFIMMIQLIGGKNDKEKSPPLSL